MKKPLLLLAILLSTASAAQAQIMTAIQLVQLATERDPSDKNVVKVTYQGRKFPMKRTPTDQLSGPGADQIALVENLLEKCRTAMLADSVNMFCSTEQKNAINLAEAILTDARPTWSQKFYDQEAAFYLNENARRKRLQDKLAPTK